MREYILYDIAMTNQSLEQQLLEVDSSQACPMWFLWCSNYNNMAINKKGCRHYEYCKRRSKYHHFEHVINDSWALKNTIMTNKSQIWSKSMNQILCEVKFIILINDGKVTWTGYLCKIKYTPHRLQDIPTNR